MSTTYSHSITGLCCASQISLLLKIQSFGLDNARLTHFTIQELHPLATP